MKRFSMWMGALALGFGLMATAGVRAADTEPSDTPAQTGMLDHKTSGDAVRASQLIGMTVRSAEGKDLGTVSDIVLDAEDGRVRYAAVSYGGFLGLGDKLFAVPWQAFECRRNQDGDGYLLVLNASEATIKNAQGFDQDQWPNFADRQFTRSLDRYYGVEGRRADRQARRADRRGGVGVEAEIGPGGVRVDVDTPERQEREVER